MTAATRRVALEYIEGSIDGYNGQGVLVDADSIVPTDDMTSLYLSDDGVSVIQDITAL